MSWRWLGGVLVSIVGCAATTSQLLVEVPASKTVSIAEGVARIELVGADDVIGLKVTSLSDRPLVVLIEIYANRLRVSCGRV